MRVRKRVTLMVIIVSVIFGICWATLQVCFTLMDVASVSIGPLAFDVAFTMVLFNSAINPFVYALLNQQFKEKMKGMICGNHSLSRIQPSNEIEGKVNTDNTTNTSKTSESKFKDWFEVDLLCKGISLRLEKGSFSWHGMVPWKEDWFIMELSSRRTSLGLEKSPLNRGETWINMTALGLNFLSFQ